MAGGLIYAGALLGMWIVLAGQPDVQDLIAGSAVGAAAMNANRGGPPPGAAQPRTGLVQQGQPSLR